MPNYQHSRCFCEACEHINSSINSTREVLPFFFHKTGEKAGLKP